MVNPIKSTLDEELRVTIQTQIDPSGLKNYKLQLDELTKQFKSIASHQLTPQQFNPQYPPSIAVQKGQLMFTAYSQPAGANLATDPYTKTTIPLKQGQLDKSKGTFSAKVGGISQTTVEVSKLNKEFGLLQEQTKKSGNHLIDLSRKAFNIVPVWMVIRGVISSFSKLLGDSIQFLVMWENEMAKIQVVGGKTATDLKVLSDALIQVGISLGVSLKDVAEGARLWAQQGKNYSEIIPLMKTTAQLSMITGRSMAESVEDLTSAMVSFHISAASTGRILDSLVAIDLKYAVTTDVLVAALRKVGPVADQMGLSLEKTLGIITATHLATRASGEEIGNAWKTILTRVSTTSRGAIQAIADVAVYQTKEGVITKENTGLFRDWSDILDEIAIKYVNLNPVQQADLAAKIAGVRQITKLTAALNQWAEGQDAALTAMMSYGAGQRAANILSETTAAKIKKLEASWAQLITTIGDTGWMRAIIDNLQMVNETWTSIFSSGIDNAIRKQQQNIDNLTSSMNKEIQALEAYLALKKEVKVIEEQIAVARAAGNEEAVRQLEKRQEKINKDLKANEAQFAGKTQETVIDLKVTRELKLNNEQIIKENEVLIKALLDSPNKAIREAAQEAVNISGGEGSSRAKRIIKKMVQDVQSDIGGSLARGLVGSPVLEAIANYSRAKAQVDNEDMNAVNESIAKQDFVITLIKEQINNKTTLSDLETLINKQLSTRQELEAQNLEIAKASAAYEKDRSTKNLEALQNAIKASQAAKNAEGEYLSPETVKVQEEAIKAQKEYGVDAVAIQRQLIALYEDTNNHLDPAIATKLKEELDNILIPAKKYNDFLRNEEIRNEMLIGQGKNLIQIAIEKLNRQKDYLKAQGKDIENNEEIKKQHAEILKLIQAEINAYAAEFRNQVSGGLSSFLKGESTITEFGDKVAESYKSAVLDNFSQGVTEQLFQLTGINQAFGQQIFNIRHLFESQPKTLAESLARTFRDGGDYLEQSIKDGLVQGTAMAQQGTVGGTGGLTGGLTGGQLMKQKTGILDSITGFFSNMFGGGAGGGLNIGSIFGQLFGQGGTGLSALFGGGSGVKAVNVGGLNAKGLPMTYNATGNQAFSGVVSGAGQAGMGGGGFLSSLGGLFGGGGAGGMGGIASLAMSALTGFSAFRSAAGASGGVQKTAGFLGAAAPFATMIPGIGPFVGGAMTVASMIMGLFKKKQVETEHQTTTELKQIATKIEVSNKQLEVVNRNLVALRNEKTFILPESAYFSSKTNLEDEFSVHSSRGIIG